MADARETYARALANTNHGRFPQARRLLEQARADTDDPDLLARIDLTSAYVAAETGDPAGALATCEELLDHDELSTETIGRTWLQLGLLHMRAGESDAAMVAFGEAATRLKADPEPYGRVLINRGNVHLQRGDAAAAAADFADAGEQFGRAGLDVERAKARFNVGYAELLRGDLVAALRGMDAARDVLAPLSPAYRATVEQDRAEVLVAAGMSREAIRALDAAAAAYGSRRLRRFQADCELALAQTLLRSDPARARVVARRAARRFRGQGSELPALRAEGVAAAAEVATGGRTPALRRRLDDLATTLQERDAPRDALPLRLQAVRLVTARGELDDATARLKGVRVRPTDPLAVRLHWREVQAELDQAHGRGALARRHVRAGLADLHAWQSSFGSLDLQSTLVGHGRDLAQLGLRSALDDGRPDLVLRVVRACPGPGRAGGAGATPARPAAGRRPDRAPGVARCAAGAPLDGGTASRRARRLDPAAQLVRRGRRRGRGTGSPRGRAGRARPHGRRPARPPACRRPARGAGRHPGAGRRPRPRCCGRRTTSSSTRSPPTSTWRPPTWPGRSPRRSGGPSTTACDRSARCCSGRCSRRSATGGWC